MHLASAFDSVVEELNALSTELKLEPIKHYVTLDDSIVLQDLSEYSMSICFFYHLNFLVYHSL